MLIIPLFFNNLTNQAVVVISAWNKFIFWSHAKVNLSLSSPPNSLCNQEPKWIPKRGSSVEHEFLAAVCWKKCLEDVGSNTSRVTSVWRLGRSFKLLGQPCIEENIALFAVGVSDKFLNLKLLLFQIVNSYLGWCMSFARKIHHPSIFSKNV